MLGQRRRQWTNIEPALGQRLVFAGLMVQSSVLWSCIGDWHQFAPYSFIVGPPSAMLSQHLIQVDI